MRKTLVVMALALVASQAAADTRQRSVDRRAADAVPGAPWAQRARVTTSDLVQEANFTAGQALANRPIAQIETNYYTFLTGEPLQVRMTTHANGYTGPVTMYLYWENRTTGERRYFNTATRALLAAGQTSDLFGGVGAPVPVVVPQLSDFVLFGTATDSAQLGFGVNGALGGSITTPAAQTGLFQYVLEIRDGAGRRVLARSNAMYSYIESSVPVSGTITANTTWTANRRYVLADFVGVASPATLTIEPGTVIYGGNNRATLFIQRGAKIMADGTARRPIIFTSPQKTGGRSQTDWGSLVVLGNAPINDNRQGAGEAVLEGLPDQPQYRYGGSNAGESSGVLRYVRLEFGGFEIQPAQEINGLTMAGVGNGTLIDYVQVLQNKDDAFEWFGGTANAKHLVGIGFADDGLDWDLGWVGNVQYAVMIKRAGNDESDGNVLIEGDNHPVTQTLTPLTNPRVYNVTGYGSGSTTVGNYGTVLRRGTAGKIYNAIITGSRRAPVTIRDTATFNNATSGELIFNNSLFGGSFADSAFQSADNAASIRTFLFQTMQNNRAADPMLAAGAPTLVKTYMPDLTPLPDSPALDASFVANPPDNGFFDQVDFIGAIGPNYNWLLTGWANFSDN